MICDNCKRERLITDFINNHKFCYKCVYRKKLTKSTGKRTERLTFCRICHKQIINEKDQQKRQRTIFCSCQCAAKGHKDQLNNYWIRKIRTDSKAGV